MEFIKIRDVKDPERDVKENAGIDFYIPEFNSFTEEELSKFGDNVFFEDNKIIIEPHCSALIPSGIMSKFDNNIALVACNRSGIAAKKHLIHGAHIVDCSYQGEIFVNLINTSDEEQYLEFGQKFIQFIPFLISTDEFVIKNETPEEFYTETTNRGGGALGSTDNK